jgi:hypothetical protein
MANRNDVPSPVLPLPPLEYDVQYMNTLIRLLNYYIQQQDNPGQIRGSGLYLSDGDPDIDVIIETRTAGDITKVVLLELPTSATGLVSGQVWNSIGNLRIIP